MSPGRSIATPKTIIEDVLGRDMSREIWTGNFKKALPISIQDFNLSSVLPAVFYMFRFGQSRGKGRFIETFGLDVGTAKERKRSATIERVAGKLAEEDQFTGFSGEAEQAILGDLLLCFCLENVKHALGRKEQIQRVAPAHYMSSWIDLPERVSNLRYVPEMIVAMLANQDGDYVRQNQGEEKKTWFAVGRDFEKNVLLRAFHQGITRQGELASRTSDQFEEETPVGLDQLLMIRLAQNLGAAPDKLRGSEGVHISNQYPISEKAAREFSEDIRNFVHIYAERIPRHAFVELLESCLSVGLTTIVTNVIAMLFQWADTGEIPDKCDQKPTDLFCDCSNGIDRSLRMLSEQSLEDFMRQVERFPVILMVLRLLDRYARYDRKLRALNIPTKPYATSWFNLLGEILFERRCEAKAILYDLDQKSAVLAEKLEMDYPEASQILRNTESQTNPAWRLAESITSLQGRRNTQEHIIQLLDSVLLEGRPNGLALKRTTSRKTAIKGTRKKKEVRSLVLTDSVLDYLVHLHIQKRGKQVRPISFKDFIFKIHDRYGFCVDVAPSGMKISNDLLQANKNYLERRLRDLGLLIGVNDAESMKRLQTRFELKPTTEREYGMV